MLSRTTILALVAGLLPLNCAASSFVYEDIIAQPRYRVVLTENKIPESLVYTDIEQGEAGINGDNSKDDSLSTHFTTYTKPAKANQVIMMSAYGQPFQCTIPIVEEQEEDSKSTPHKNNDNDIVNEEEDTQKIIDRGLKLLEPLSSKGCIYYQKPDYWTYEYCHKKHVRQFHVDRSAIQTDPPTRTPQGPSFYLGVFSPTRSTGSTGDGDGSSTKATTSEKTDIAEPSTSLKHIGNQRYLTQKWSDGSECDLTGKPRSIEVQFHCDMNSGDRISMLQEVTTCQYQMTITTPRLCEEMMLASQTQSDANKIQCDPIVPDHMLRSMSVNQLEEQQTVVEEPAEPELQPEVQGESTDSKKSDADELKNQEKLQQNTKQQPIQANQDLKGDLMELISGLTAQINDLQRQVRGGGASSMTLESLLKERSQQENSGGDNNNDGSKKEEIEIAYFHVDENGVLVPQEGMDMKKLMESYMKMLTSVKDNQNQKPPKKTESKEDREQQRNRKAYEMTYFQ